MAHISLFIEKWRERREMNIDTIKHIIQQGEGLNIKFKKSQFELNKDVFDSVHREFGHAYPAKLIIEKDRVVTENWNRAQGIGHIGGYWKVRNSQ